VGRSIRVVVTEGKNRQVELDACNRIPNHIMYC
jgi:hypothetical protein